MMVDDQGRGRRKTFRRYLNGVTDDSHVVEEGKTVPPSNYFYLRPLVHHYTRTPHHLG